MIDIFYRLCEDNSKSSLEYDVIDFDKNMRIKHRPNWFFKKKCLLSFLNAVNEAKDFINSVTFIHDGPEGNLLTLIPKEFNVIKINELSNYGSLSYTYQIAKDMTNDLYFVEDDYLHLPDSLLKITKAVSIFQLVSGYDHPHRYYGDDDIDYPKMLKFSSELKFGFFNYDQRDHHWRTSESTCHTFAISRNLFNEIYHIAQDHHCKMNDRHFFRTLHSMGILLWTPVPSLITQVDPCMAPGIDWEKFNSSVGGK
jgi:hypothetical protein